MMMVIMKQRADINVAKKWYISLEERQHIIDELRLIPKKDVYFYRLLMN